MSIKSCCGKVSSANVLPQVKNKRWERAEGKHGGHKVYKVLMMIMTTTSTISPTLRPTLSLRSEAFLLSLEASDRKRPLDVFKRSDLKKCPSSNLAWQMWYLTCLEDLKGCYPSQEQNQCCPSLPQSPCNGFDKITQITGNFLVIVILLTSSTWVRNPARRSPSRGPEAYLLWIFGL